MIVIESEWIPPSVNALFVNVPGKGRVRSKAYKDWVLKAGWDYNGVGHVSGPYSMVITVSKDKLRKGRDLGNIIKATEDICVAHKIVEDDSMCQSLAILFGETTKGMRVDIEAA